MILVGLFVFQNRGTEKIGKVFGPVMALWFIVLAVLGAIAIAREPQILYAANPLYAFRLFAQRALDGLCGAGLRRAGGDRLRSALRRHGPFRRQGHPLGLALFRLSRAGAELFRPGRAAAVAIPRRCRCCSIGLVPGWAHYPMVALATIATIIASQAVISGVFSITQQAVQLGQLPRMEIRHTSATEAGQIYVPRSNAMLAVGVVLIVLIFKSSDALAAAYGIAVTGVMVISTVLVAVVARYHWNWSKRWP